MDLDYTMQGRVNKVVVQRANDWERIVEWLELKWGEGTPVVGHQISNDDLMTSDRLLRTSSFQYILKQSKVMAGRIPLEDS